MNESEETLREALLDLERARRAERKLRVQTEGLLEGLELLGSSEDNEQMFEQLLELLRDLLHYDEAAVLTGESTKRLEPIAATTESLAKIVWEGDRVTRRAVEGDPVAVFDVELIDEWQPLIDDLDIEVASALHIGLRGKPRVSLLVCLHSEPGFFSNEHVQLARRLSGLAAQALVNRDLRELKLKAFERSVRGQFFSASRDLMAILDFDGGLRQINPAFEAQLGYDRAELTGKNIIRLCDPRDVEAVEQTFADIVDQQRSATLEGRFLADDGEVRWLEWNLSPSFDDELIYAAARDITIRRRTEQRLRKLNEELSEARDKALEANRAKSQFLANMSHELRTPLNAVIGYAEILREELDDEEINSLYLEDVERIRIAGKHLLSLINDVLDLSKIEAGRTELHVETFAVDELYEDIESTFTTLVEQNGNHFEVNAPDEIGVMTSDPAKVRQILFNLLSNAAKFTSDGEIYLDIEPVDHDDRAEICFTVSDTGIGMTEEELERVFEAFVQADSSATREFEGTGLGLTLTRYFVSLLGGRIDVESTPGEGTTFEVWLPRTAPIEDEATEATLPASSDVEIDQPSANIVVIDDGSNI